MDIRNILDKLDFIVEAAPTKFEPTHFHKSELGSGIGKLFGKDSPSGNELMLHSDGNFYWMDQGKIARWNGNPNNRSSANPASVDGEIVNGEWKEYPEGVTFADKQKQSDTEVEVDKDGNPKFKAGQKYGTVDGVGVEKVEKTAAELEQDDYEAEMELFAIEKEREKLGKQAVELEKKLKQDPENAELLKKVDDVVKQEKELDQKERDQAVKNNPDPSKIVEPGKKITSDGKNYKVDDKGDVVPDEGKDSKPVSQEQESVTLSDGSKFTKNDEKQIYAKVQDIIKKADALIKQANLKESILNLVDESFVVEGISQADKIQLKQYIDDLKKLSGASFVANTMKDVIKTSVKSYEDALASPAANEKSGSLQAFLNSGKKGLADEQGEKETVEELQKMLIDLGYDVGDKGADGIYGSDTAKAVREFQKKAGLSVDGDAGPSTIAMLLNPGDKDVSKDGKPKKDDEPLDIAAMNKEAPQTNKELDTDSADNAEPKKGDDLKPADKVLSPEDEAELAAKYDADAKEADKELDSIKKNAGIDTAPEKSDAEEKSEIAKDSAEEKTTTSSSAGGDLMKRAYDNVLKIRDAVDGLGTDENAVYKVLGSVENDIEWAAMNIIDPNLSKAIADDMSGFMGAEMIKAKEILSKKDISWKPSSGAAVPDGAIRAFRLNRAFDGIGTDEDEVFAVIDEIKSKEDWEEIRQFFPTVDDELSSELSGDDKDRVREKLAGIGVGVKVDSFVKKPEGDLATSLSDIDKRIEALKENKLINVSSIINEHDNTLTIRNYLDIINENVALKGAKWAKNFLKFGGGLAGRIAFPKFLLNAPKATRIEQFKLIVKSYAYYSFMMGIPYQMAKQTNEWEKTIEDAMLIMYDLQVMWNNGEFEGKEDEYNDRMSRLEGKIKTARDRIEGNILNDVGQAMAKSAATTVSVMGVIPAIGAVVGEIIQGWGWALQDSLGFSDSDIEKEVKESHETFKQTIEQHSKDGDGKSTDNSAETSTETSAETSTSVSNNSEPEGKDEDPRLAKLRELYADKAAMSYLKSTNLEQYKKIQKLLGVEDKEDEN